MNYSILVGRIPQRATMEEWGTWMSSGRDKGRVAETMIGHIRVSTVFIGCADQMFETMIFEVDDYDYQVRVDTYKRAEEEHEIAVKFAKSKLSWWEKPLLCLTYNKE